MITNKNENSDCQNCTQRGVDTYTIEPFVYKDSPIFTICRFCLRELKADIDNILDNLGDFVLKEEPSSRIILPPEPKPGQSVWAMNPDTGKMEEREYCDTEELEKSKLIGDIESAVETLANSESNYEKEFHSFRNALGLLEEGQYMFKSKATWTVADGSNPYCLARFKDKLFTQISAITLWVGISELCGEVLFEIWASIQKSDLNKLRIHRDANNLYIEGVAEADYTCKVGYSYIGNEELESLEGNREFQEFKKYFKDLEIGDYLYIGDYGWTSSSRRNDSYKAKFSNKYTKQLKVIELKTPVKEWDSTDLGLFYRSLTHYDKDKIRLYIDYNKLYIDGVEEDKPESGNKIYGFANQLGELKEKEFIYAVKSDWVKTTKNHPYYIDKFVGEEFIQVKEFFLADGFENLSEKTTQKIAESLCEFPLYELRIYREGNFIHIEQIKGEN